MPRNIEEEAGLPRREGGSVPVLGGRGDGGGQREVGQGRAATLGRGAPSPHQFLGKTDMNGRPSREKRTVGSCLAMDDVAVGGREENPHSRSKSNPLMGGTRPHRRHNCGWGLLLHTLHFFISSTGQNSPVSQGLLFLTTFIDEKTETQGR